MMKIHRIQTGKVKIKRNQIEKSHGIAPKLSKVLFDKDWSDWLPIYSWLIEHPEGLFVVDTGETAKTGITGYLPKWHPYYAMGVRFDVTAEEEIGPQLSRMGVDPTNDIRMVIMTHMHTDHAGGLHHFPNSEIMINRGEWKAATGTAGILAGYLPHRWPDWLKPTLIAPERQSFGPFDHSRSLTRDGAVRIVATPGHTVDHMSVIVKVEDLYYFLAGDASYNQINMLKGVPDGVGTRKSESTLSKIRDFTEKFPTLYLPSHDPGVPHRMETQEIVPVYYKTEEPAVVSS